MDYLNSINILTKYIIKKYNSLKKENNAIGGNNNVKRCTMQIMSCYVENAIALFINDVLKRKKYNIIVEPQFSIGYRNIKKPDIVIYDNKNVIHGIIEIKAQLGYFKKGDGESFTKKIKTLKNASSNNLLSLNKVPFTISNNCIDMFVVLMKSNHSENIKKLEYESREYRFNYYVLYNGNYKNVWYDKFPSDMINKEENGMYDFIEKVNGI